MQILIVNVSYFEILLLWLKTGCLNICNRLVRVSCGPDVFSGGFVYLMKGGDFSDAEGRQNCQQARG
ncbi:hypothetical protein HMPREF9056_02159 [Actinomyces sp. oral taxon 170 str. F0386]|nr:hypothetical protein HMPREF9056_02159 [Actinomyces sp. oral taxon 170 str. F0386]